MDKNEFIGKKRNLSESQNSNNNNLNKNNSNDDSLNSTQNSNTIINTNLLFEDKLYNEGITLTNHTHWINKVLILKNQPKHNLISSSADGKIIIYDTYPLYKSMLEIKLFGESGVTYLTELKNGSIIACSFGAIKQFLLKYNSLENKYIYEVINYYAICTSYISKCIELINEDLLFISQQNSIIIMKKIKKDNYNKKNENIKKKEEKGNLINDTFVMQSPIKLLKYEICINIEQLNQKLLISGNITDPKYNIIERHSNKINNNNSINFYDDKYNVISKIKNVYCTKSQENIIKVNDKYVIVGIEICFNEVNWNNKKGIALIDYINYQILSFYEVSNQISSILLYENNLYIGDNKGYIEKYIIKYNDIIFQKNKRVHFYNINSITYDYIYDNDLNQKIFLIITGSNDGKIKILSYFND